MLLGGQGTESVLAEKIEREHFLRLRNIRLTYLQSVNSTQSFTRDVLKSDCEGDLVISKVQTAGMGREGRSWVSDKGGLWMTITLKPPDTQVLGKVIYIAASAVVRTLEEYGVKNCSIKLPNDVYCDGRKIAGLLADTVIQGKDSKVYLGIGIDVNNDVANEESISQIATSVASELGNEIDLAEFAVSFLKSLDLQYDQELRSHNL
ncbi:MAG: biotin--[acetyl-CoA-carboxylase] ligase [Nitrososphaerales archaeon]